MKIRFAIRIPIEPRKVGPIGLGVEIHAREQRKREAIGLLAGFMLGHVFGSTRCSPATDALLAGFAAARRRP